MRFVSITLNLMAWVSFIPYTTSPLLLTSTEMGGQVSHITWVLAPSCVLIKLSRLPQLSLYS